MTSTILQPFIVENRFDSARSLRPIRVALLCDYREENWYSMDLVGDMLTDHLAREHENSVHAEQIVPHMPQPFGTRREGFLRNAHRALGRFVAYPREVRRLRESFDLFHIVDHSYAHLALELPPERVIVTCHDLDAFSPLLPGSPALSPLRVRLARPILAGLRRAAWVVCASDAMRHQLLQHRLVQAERTSVVHNGVHPVFTASANPNIDAAIARLLNSGESPEVLHVGSTIRRKRIQDVLGIFAKLRARLPRLRLLRVGGVFTSEQQRLVRELGLQNSIDVFPHIDAAQLASVYRRARVLIQPSESEGFGLPVAEAMACGTPVIASDIPALREVGGNAAEYCPVGDIDAWSSRAFELLGENSDRREVRSRACVEQAAQFSWSRYASRMAGLYREVLAW
jgi:glycosyltransferase involved in cell wall biosynthesis